MNKMSVLMLVAGIIAGSALTMYGVSGRIDQIDAYNSELWQKANRLENENHILKIQVRTSREELAQVIDRMPPNIDACWRSYRRSQKSVASR